MESRNTTAAGSRRAHQMRTRLQAKKEQADRKQREQLMQGLSEQEYWRDHVKSKEDIIRFYHIYKPEYPEVLAIAIAERVSGIIEKSQRGEVLTEEERGYVLRSKQEPEAWDFREELRQQELAGKVQMAVRRLEELKTE